jgi:hypothetical protein
VFDPQGACGYVGYGQGAAVFAHDIGELLRSESLTVRWRRLRRKALDVRCNALTALRFVILSRGKKRIGFPGRRVADRCAGK